MNIPQLFTGKLDCITLNELIEQLEDIRKVVGDSTKITHNDRNRLFVDEPEYIKRSPEPSTNFEGIELQAGGIVEGAGIYQSLKDMAALLEGYSDSNLSEVKGLLGAVINILESYK